MNLDLLIERLGISIDNPKYKHIILQEFKKAIKAKKVLNEQKKEKLGRYEGGKKVGELNEQSIVGSLTRILADPSNVGLNLKTNSDFSTDLSSGMVDPNTTAQEKVKELFEKAKKEFGNRLLPEETLNRLEEDAKKLKAAMDGAGISGTEVKRILKSIKGPEELNNLLIFFECGDLNPNKDCGKSLYNWFDGEYTISWNTIWNALKPRFDKYVYHGGGLRA